jgi:hypothetical protein
LHEKVHAPAAQAGCPCATLVVHACPHVPQLLASFVGSTHVALVHRVGAVDEQLGTQVDAPREEEQIGVAPAHVVLHPPQCAGCVISASQPSLAMPLQSAKPGAHAEPGNAHWPAVHETTPLTCASAVQSFPQEPHVAGFERSVAHPAPTAAQSA